jgi:hypothetical protein
MKDMRWATHEARMGGMRCIKLVGGKPEGKSHWGGGYRYMYGYY